MNINTPIFTNNDLKKLIVPLVIEQILVILIGMVDTVMVSHVGEAAISGVALVDMLEYFVITLFAALATGGCVVISQYVGHKEPEEAERSSGQLLHLSAVFSLAVMAVCLAGHGGILRVLFGKTEPAVMEAADIYFSITAWSFPFLGLYNAGCALLRTMKKTKATMAVSVLMNLVNIAGNTIGVFVLRAGVAGVAAPTVIARAVACIAIWVSIYCGNGAIKPSLPCALIPNNSRMIRLLRMAIPNSVENGLFALGRVLVTGIVALCSTEQMAAFSVANSIDQIAILVVSAINLAMVLVVGQCIGADEPAQAKVYTQKLMRISYITTAVLGVGICLLLPVILRCYRLSNEAAACAAALVVIHNLLAILLHPTSFNLANSLRAAGDARFTMAVGVVSMLAFRLGSARLFAVRLGLGIYGVWIAMGMDWLARSAAFTWRFKSGKWKNRKAI